MLRLVTATAKPGSYHFESGTESIWQSVNKIQLEICMIAKYNNNTYIANMKDEHVVLVTHQEEKATKGFAQKRDYYKKKIDINDKGLTDFYVQYNDIEEGSRKWLVDEGRAIGINGSIEKNEVITDISHDSKHSSWIQYDKGAAAKKIKLDDCNDFMIKIKYIKQNGKNITKTEEMQVEPDEFKHMMVQLRRVNF